MEPTTSLLLWHGLAGLLTLAIFSFLLGDNPLYKFAERLWVGVSTGYWTMLLQAVEAALYTAVVAPVGCFALGRIRRWFLTAPSGRLR